MSAIVSQVTRIEKHPNADRLDLVTIEWGAGIGQRVTVVTGAHYREGWRGVYFDHGTLLPGYLAEDSWLVGRGKSNQWFEVQIKNMRGVESPGIFCCQFYMKTADPRDQERAKRMAALAEQRDDWQNIELATPVYQWPYWRDHWQTGEDVSAYLGVQDPTTDERYCCGPEGEHPQGA